MRLGKPSQLGTVGSIGAVDHQINNLPQARVRALPPSSPRRQPPLSPDRSCPPRRQPPLKPRPIAPPSSPADSQALTDRATRSRDADGDSAGDALIFYFEREETEMATGDISPSKAILLHFLCCCVSLTSSYLLATGVFEWSLVTHPAQTLVLLVLTHSPVVIGVYSSLRRDPERCSYWKAVGRGLLGLPVGSLLNAFGAIVLGAPVGMKYFASTLTWSLLMSLFTFVPASCVFGSSRKDWQQFLGYSKITYGVDCMISLPAHGAVIGAWLGAWPMPLDWERTWQEWPICVTYGALAGFLIGMLASLLLVLVLAKRRVHVKAE